MLLYHAITSAVLLVLLANLCANLRVFRRPRTGLPRGEGTVSILVPARNEASRITPCIRSLLDQDDPDFEILILDDHSNDGTADTVREAADDDPRLRVLTGTELPPGWTGKAWACHQLAQAASGNLLLFTDADTRHQPDAVRCAVAELRARSAGMLSLWPRQITLTYPEKLVVPYVHVLLLFFLPHWMSGTNRSLGAANGQFLLFRRDAYDTIGGHESVRSHLVDDVALARAAKELDLNPANLDGSRHVSCRMYDSMRGVWEGFSKNLYPGFEGNTGSFLCLLAIQAAVLFGPFLLLVIEALLLLRIPWIALAQILIIAAMHASIAIHCRQNFAPGRLTLGQLLVILIALNSWRLSRSRRLSWKGRTYP